MECPTCGRTFTQVGSYNRHLQGHSQEKNFSCNNCDKSFARKDAAQRHEKNCKRKIQPTGSGLPAKRPRPSSKGNFTVTKTKTAFQNATVTRQLKNSFNTGSLDMIDPSVRAMEYQLHEY